MNFRKGLILGIFAEVLILAYCYSNFAESGEVFRHAARYSGRLSFIVYLLCLYLFAYRHSKTMSQVKKAVSIFCVLHLIHFWFLAANIYLNHITLVPAKLAGGFLGYALILVYPFMIKKVKPSSILHFIYFYYLSLVMGITNIARIKGQFEGASPEGFHYFALAILAIALVIFTFLLISKRNHQTA